MKRSHSLMDSKISEVVTSPLGLLESLIADTISEIVNRLDLPSRLSLALTCRPLHASYWPGRNPNFFTPWEFLDKGAELGYLNLLKYAYQNGALVDEKVLSRAVSSNQVEVTRWLLAALPDLKMDTKLTIAKEAIIVGGRPMFELFRNVLSGPEAEEQLYQAAASGGHVELCLEFFQGKEMESNFLWMCALLGGHFELAERLVDEEMKGQYFHVSQVARAAVTFGNRKWLEWTLDRQGSIDSSQAIDSITSSISVDFLKYLLEKFPDLDLRSVCNKALKKRTLEMLTFLIEKGLSFQEIDIFTLFDTNFSEMGPLIQSPERFACIQFAFNLGLRWGSDDLRGALNWVTVSQAQWLYENATDSKILFKASLYHFQYSGSHVGAIDIGVLEYLISQNMFGFEGSLFRSLVGCTNNIQVLNFLIRFGFENELKAALEAQLPTFVESILASHLGKIQNTFQFLRPRYHNWICILKWLCDHGINFKTEVIATLRAIEHPFFQREIQILFHDLN